MSGNPAGRPPLPTEEKKTLARDAAPKALQRLTELIVHKGGDVALAACEAILDHAYEKLPTETGLLTRRSANYGPLSVRRTWSGRPSSAAATS